MLLVAGLAVPDERVMREFVEAADQPGVLPGATHDATGLLVTWGIDCQTLSFGSVAAPEISVLEEAAGGYMTARAQRENVCDQLVADAARHLNGQPLEPAYPYLRYWHGSGAFVPPILAVAGISGLRAITQAAVLAALALLAHVVRDIAGTRTAAALLLPIMVTVPLEALTRSVPHGAAATVGLVGASLIARAVARGAPVSRLWYLAITAGAAFVYVDVLTAVPAFPALAATLAGVAGAKQGLDDRDLLQVTSTTVLGWMSGYAGMWSMKWLFATMFFGAGTVWDQITRQIGFRLSGQHDRVVQGFGEATAANLRRFSDQPFSWAVIAVIAVLVLLTIRRTALPEISRLAIVASPMLIIPIWYESLSNHSQLHHWFTYRSISVAAGIVAMLTLVKFPRREDLSSGSRVQPGGRRENPPAIDP